MKKFLITALLITALILTLGIPAFAIEEGAASEEQTAEQNVFEVCYGEIMKHSDKILSALAFLGSLIIAFAYRKGLLPVVKGALNALGAAVAKLKEETENANAAANERLESANALLGELAERLSSLEAELATAKDAQARNADMRVILRAQIDMLYEVFMSSSLPAYQKESVGDRITEMKRVLSASDTEAEGC